MRRNFPLMGKGNKYSKLELEISSDKKGSNPGGQCICRGGKTDFLAYFKYCYGSKIKGASSLKPENQPIYEAITFELANRLGLKTSRFFVLINRDRSVRFTDPQRLSSDNSGRDYYFISKMENVNQITEEGKGILESEKIYLESLNISDILGKRQNYLVLPGFDEKHQIVYIDLGCSFVHAIGGFIYLPSRQIKIRDKSLNKKILHKLQDKTIIGADNSSLINLGELASNLPNMTIPTLNPLKRMRVCDLISKDECEEIEKYILANLYESLEGYGSRGLLL